jgi:pilus assembly protein CpaB
MKIKPRILMALLLAVISMIFVGVYITTKEKVLEEELTKVQVVVAADDILPSTPIEETMVTTTFVPKRYLQPGAYSDPELVKGQIAETGIKKGAQILGTELSSYGRGRGLAFKVPVGKRAVTIAISDVSGVANLIQPGNYVDIVGVFKFGSFTGTAPVHSLSIAPNQQSQALTLFQNVWVLAAGQDSGAAADLTEKQREREKAKLEALSQNANPMAKPEEKEAYRTITLALAPDQAQDLILAQHLGELSVVLRSFREGNTITELKNSTAVSVLKVDMPVVPRAAPAWREIRGGQ